MRNGRWIGWQPAVVGASPRRGEVPRGGHFHVGGEPAVASAPAGRVVRVGANELLLNDAGETGGRRASAIPSEELPEELTEAGASFPTTYGVTRE